MRVFSLARVCVVFSARPDAKAALSTAELALSFKALLKNPKCYGAWHHRIWVMDLGATDVQAELHLCDKMLMADARNCQWTTQRDIDMYTMGRGR